MLEAEVVAVAAAAGLADPADVLEAGPSVGGGAFLEKDGMSEDDALDAYLLC
jgi:hypothetical protein